MSNTYLKATAKPRLPVKLQVLATVLAIAGAVALPQIFHVLGAWSGLGTALGETFLPMHLPIILVGLLAGPYAGAIAGLLSPLVSIALSGMPGAAMLPFMVIELCTYGLLAGLLRNVQIPTLLKVIAVQLGGRIIRAVAIFTSVYAFGNEAVGASSVWTSIVTGILGIILQWALLPLIVYRAESPKSSHEQ